MSVNSVTVNLLTQSAFRQKPVADFTFGSFAPSGALRHCAIYNRNFPIAANGNRQFVYSWQSPYRIMYSWQKSTTPTNTATIISKNGAQEFTDISTGASTFWAYILAEPNDIINVYFETNTTDIATETVLHHWRFDTWAEFVQQNFSYFMNEIITAPTIYYPNTLTANKSFLINFTNQYFEKDVEYVLGEFANSIHTTIVNARTLITLGAKSPIFNNTTQIASQLLNSPDRARWVIKPSASGNYTGTMTCIIQANGRQTTLQTLQTGVIINQTIN